MSSKLKLLSKLGVISLVVVLLGAGCNPFANSPKENLAEMRKNMSEVKTVKFQANASAKGVKQENSQKEGKEQGQMNQFLSGGPLSNAEKFDIELSGQSALNNYSNPDSKLDISVSVSDSDQKIQLNLRQVQGTNYLKVGSLGPLQSSPMVAMLGSKLVGNWLELPDSQTKPESKDERKDLTEKQKQEIKQLIKDTNFVKVVKDLGEETVNGRSAYHYQVKANKSEIENFSEKMREITNTKD
jgi:hypothetical protein